MVFVFYRSTIPVCNIHHTLWMPAYYAVLGLICARLEIDMMKLLVFVRMDVFGHESKFSISSTGVSFSKNWLGSAWVSVSIFDVGSYLKIEDGSVVP